MSRKKPHLLINAITLVCIASLSACGGGGSPAASSVASVKSSSSSISSSSSSTSSSISSSASLSSASSSSLGDPLSASITGLIVVDQFGYLPDAQKVAVLRNPQVGYDADQSYTPSAQLSLVNMDTGALVMTAAASVWNGGATDASSGDKAWWFDFTSVTQPGTYAVVDIDQQLRSPSFKIAANVYQPVLKEAMRVFFYQRAGFAKQQPYADAAWADGASHLGAGQSANARLYSDKANAATERDLSGGWYDAGDFSEYTNWTARYVITLLHAYLENPAAWTDDFNIPESGNGIPDILDEVKWGMDWLIKMQDATGDNSVLSILGVYGASPPSSTTGASYYGPASTSATLSTAAAFALGAKVFAGMNNADLMTYAGNLKNRAVNAWNWAESNPSVVFRNNEGASAGVGAGQQETDDTGRARLKQSAAIYLYAATGDTQYRDFVDGDYSTAPLIALNFADPYRENQNTDLLYYANLPDATAAVANKIKSTFSAVMEAANNWQAIRNNTDPYRAFLGSYTWGSNGIKSLKGTMFTDLVSFQVGTPDATEVRNAALRYINYINGVNPQGMVYLSNMYALGVHSSVNEFYHTWFTNGSALWDRVGTSTYGPAPGYLVGGPNPSYNWDANCDSNSPNAGCGSTPPNPPTGQPAQKSYKDFNTSWPLNSWSVTENSDGYQSNFVRLLSKFVNTQ